MTLEISDADLCRVLLEALVGSERSGFTTRPLKEAAERAVAQHRAALEVAMAQAMQAMLGAPGFRDRLQAAYEAALLAAIASKAASLVASMKRSEIQGALAFGREGAK